MNSNKNVYEIKHMFVICAYGDSIFLEDCIKSLMNQTVKTNVMMITSTPSEYLSDLACKYDIPIYINEGEKGIAGDWNFAIECAKNYGNAHYVTIAHQDDIYCEDYAKMVISCIERYSNPLIAFTDYGELRNSSKVNKNRLLNIKRIMLLPMKIKTFSKSVWIRRRILSFGDAISCPTVTYCLDNLRLPIFESGFKCNLDWQAWEKLSKCRGDFVYIPKILMYHRIHEESTTSGLINGEGRKGEDLAMFKKFWPNFIANMLIKKYSKAEDSNSL